MLCFGATFVGFIIILDAFLFFFFVELSASTIHFSEVIIFLAISCYSKKIILDSCRSRYRSIQNKQRLLFAAPGKPLAEYFSIRTFFLVRISPGRGWGSPIYELYRLYDLYRSMSYEAMTCRSYEGYGFQEV